MILLVTACQAISYWYLITIVGERLGKTLIQFQIQKGYVRLCLMDKSIIEKNLKLTPEERVKNHQGALEFAMNLIKAGRKLVGKPQRTVKKTS